MKIVLITGASGNLGKDLCQEFLSAGYRVIAITGMHDSTEAFESNRKIDFHKVDLSSEMEVDQLCEEICTLYGRIDAAAFLAGGYAMGGFDDTGKAQLDAMYRLNFETAYFISRRVFQKMQQQGGGRIFFIGAKPAIQSANASGMIAYALSKTLVVKLSELYNAAGKKHGVVSAVIIPSVIDTPANRKANPDADFTQWVSPRKISRTLLFLCSQDGDAVRDGVFKLYGNS